jgi:hypothetical protein
MLLTSSVDDDFLPAFYQELGGKNGGESERVLLQRDVDQYADVFDISPFKVSPSQIISLNTFDFMGLSMAEVGTEVLPQRIIPPEDTSLSAPHALSTNNSQAETYSLIFEPTVVALSIADTQRLHNKNGHLPVNWMEA